MALRGLLRELGRNGRRGVDRAQPLRGCLCLGVAPQAGVARVQLLELFNGLGGASRRAQLFGQHEAEVVLIRTELGELFQRAERLFLVTRIAHAVGVLEEVLLGVSLEALCRADFPELVVDDRSSRRGAQNLVAERNRVIEEAPVLVQIDGALVDGDGLGHIADPDEEITHAIVEADIRAVSLAGVIRGENFLIGRYSLVELFF